jgi:hypothetical protein
MVTCLLFGELPSNGDPLTLASPVATLALIAVLGDFDSAQALGTSPPFREDYTTFPPLFRLLSLLGVALVWPFHKIFIVVFSKVLASMVFAKRCLVRTSRVVTINCLSCRRVIFAVNSSEMSL